MKPSTSHIGSRPFWVRELRDRRCPHLTQTEQVVSTLNHLGYPGYFASILGLWKLLGAIAIVMPRFPRLKEWAYAGFFFDLTAAAASHAAVGDSAADIAAPLVFLALVLASWALRPASRTLAAPASGERASATPVLARVWSVAQGA